MSMSCSSRWVAKLRRSVRGVTRLVIPAAAAAAWTELTYGQRVDRVAAREQPALWQHHAAAASLPPPGAQQREQLGREHRMAVFAALALLDPQHHARTVDVADLERDHLGDAQPG